MADIPCQEEEAILDRLLAQIDDAVYQLPAATIALMDCLEQHYPAPMMAAETDQENSRQSIEARCDGLCQRMRHVTSSFRSMILSVKIEREHRKAK